MFKLTPSAHELTHLFEGAWRLQQLQDGDRGYHQDGGEGERPAHPLGPRGVAVLVVLEALVVHQVEHHDGLAITNI